MRGYIGSRTGYLSYLIRVDFFRRTPPNEHEISAEGMKRFLILYINPEKQLIVHLEERKKK